MRAVLLFAAAVLLGATASPAAEVHVLQYEGAITPVAADYIVGGVEAAEADSAALLLLELDTPGGLVDSMRDIVKSFLGARVPVVVHVAPSGSRAASAGVFITMAAHVAAMAPGTNIGSASVVGMGGAEVDSTMRKKVFNDAVAYLESIAEERGRNPEWAARFVDDAENLPAERALEEGVIDLVVRTRAELLGELDGRAVTVGSRERTLSLKDAEVVEKPMGWRHRILARIANPQIAYLLLLLGVYGIFFELSNPGAIVPGVIGGIAILLALFALQALPIRAVGVALILVSFVLFLLEVYVSSYGLLSVAGVVALAAGSLMLFDADAGWGGLGPRTIVPVVGFTSLLAIGTVVLAVRGQRRPVVTGYAAMVGEAGRVVVAIGPGEPGKVVVHGEYWAASSEHAIPVGERAEVVAVEGRTVVVVPAQPS